MSQNMQRWWTLKKTATISIWYKISWLEKLGGPGKIFWKVYDAVVP